MDRPDRDEKDDAQKLKLIFLSLAALVAILLIWSLVAANKARTERDAARVETDRLKQDNAKFEQYIKEQNVQLDDLKKKLQACEEKAAKAAKAKPAAKAKKAAPAKAAKAAKKATKHK